MMVGVEGLGQGLGFGWLSPVAELRRLGGGRQADAIRVGDLGDLGSRVGVTCGGHVWGSRVG
eukprot:2224461-Prymnesium_polylepis.1